MEQVGQDLLHPFPVRKDQKIVFRAFANQFHLPGISDHNLAECGVQLFQDIEDACFAVLNGDLPCLDLGNIDDVLDQPQQDLGIFPDGPDIKGFLGFGYFPLKEL
jgi:hypothetical protein